MHKGMPLSVKVFLIAGETSGDQLGADVVRAIHTLDSSIEVLGAGGTALKLAGQNQCLDLVPHAIMGFVEVAKQFAKFKGFFDFLLEEVKKSKPDALMLIDYPGFNLRFMKAVKRLFPEMKIIYFIAPMVWAWKPKRALAMEKHLDLLLTVYHFEKEWFANYTPKLRVEFVGHPMMDKISTLPESVRSGKTLAILPGSRRTEIQKNLKVMLGAFEKISVRVPEVQASISAVSENTALQIEGILATFPQLKDRCRVVTGDVYQVIRQSFAGIVVSGTVSTECAALGLPIVIVYRMNPVTYWIAKLLVKLPYYSMVNLLGQRQVVRELQHHDVTVEGISKEILQLFEDPVYYSEVCKGLSEVKLKLGEPGAAGRAAHAVLHVLNK